jgi:hypothetical protein
MLASLKEYSAMTIRRATAAALGVGALLLLPSLAFADITAFLGSVRTPTPQFVYGGAISGSITIVVFELEYTKGAENVTKGTPGLSLGTFSVYLRTPTGRVQFYGGLGAALYRETLGTQSNTNYGLCAEGGITVGVTGPLRVRVDYRVMALHGPLDGDATNRHRIYLGALVKF